MTSSAETLDFLGLKELLSSVTTFYVDLFKVLVQYQLDIWKVLMLYLYKENFC
jgi:hypothetical protein